MKLCKVASRQTTLRACVVCTVWVCLLSSNSSVNRIEISQRILNEGR